MSTELALMDTDRWHCFGLHRSSGHTDHQCSDDLCRCPLRGMPITGSPLLWSQRTADRHAAW
ncbi:unnamed protein product [Staurois parvus]|uniref:Uncharacterized protein n=1 Tax=Staurois parvus TaxID=386267 RepID=A0ABN9FTQ2_9NEOB|nr:unnamed protein product [Staurois parvus]